MNYHPFVATAGGGKCSSCGKSRTNQIHRRNFNEHAEYVPRPCSFFERSNDDSGICCFCGFTVFAHVQYAANKKFHNMTSIEYYESVVTSVIGGSTWIKRPLKELEFPTFFVAAELPVEINRLFQEHPDATVRVEVVRR